MVAMFVEMTSSADQSGLAGDDGFLTSYVVTATIERIGTQPKCARDRQQKEG